MRYDLLGFHPMIRSTYRQVSTDAMFILIMSAVCLRTLKGPLTKLTDAMLRLY
jgi:hypothetical protein